MLTVKQKTTQPEQKTNPHPKDNRAKQTEDTKQVRCDPKDQKGRPKQKPMCWMYLKLFRNTQDY